MTSQSSAVHCVSQLWTIFLPEHNWAGIFSNSDHRCLAIVNTPYLSFYWKRKIEKVMVTDWYIYLVVGRNVRHLNVCPRNCLYRCWCKFRFVPNLRIFLVHFNPFTICTLSFVKCLTFLYLFSLMANMICFTNENNHIIIVP